MECCVCVYLSQIGWFIHLFHLFRIGFGHSFVFLITRVDGGCSRRQMDKRRDEERERDLARSCISLNFSRLVCVYRSGRPPQKLRSESNHFRVPANGPNGREKRKRADVFADIHTYWKGAPEFVFSQIRLWKTIFSLVVFSIPFIFLGALPPIFSPVQGKYIERMALRERSRSSTDNTKKSDDNTKRTHVPALRLIFLTLFYHPLYSFIWFSFVWFLSQPKGER
jgi:hypothetical protein